MWYRAVLWVLLFISGSVVHPRRTEPDVEFRPLGQTQEPWLPTVLLQQQRQRSVPPWRPSWLPQQVVQQQQSRTHAARDLWLPQVVQQTHTAEWQWQDPQTQIKVEDWPEQRPQKDVCRFNYEDVPEDHIHPFLVRSSKNEFLYPDLEGGRRVVEVASGATILASCPGNKNHLLLNERPYARVTCRGTRLLTGGEPVTWAELGCRKKPRPEVRRGRWCGSGRRSHTIGWNIRRRVFVKQITVCFNERQETTVYASHVIHGRYIDAKVVESSRPSFKTARMFSTGVPTSYTKVSQKSLLRSLLNTTEHLTGKREHYLAKGHLAADSDFVLEAEQDATYYYANVVPQWQAVNNGNWRKLETAVRELAISRNATLRVWTGTHGVLQLPDHHSNPVRLYLGLTRGKEVVPVPALLWKVIQDPSANNAVAIVEVNDVRGLGTSDSWSLREPLCPDLCHRLPWVTWDTSDFRHGMTFCCTLDALRSTISNIPSLGPVGLLRY